MAAGTHRPDDKLILLVPDPLQKTEQARLPRYSHTKTARKLQSPLEFLLDFYRQVAENPRVLLQSKVELGLSLIEAYQYLIGLEYAGEESDPAQKHYRLATHLSTLRQRLEQEASARDQEVCQGVDPRERHATNTQRGNAYYFGGPS